MNKPTITNILQAQNAYGQMQQGIKKIIKKKRQLFSPKFFQISKIKDAFNLWQITDSKINYPCKIIVDENNQFVPKKGMYIKAEKWTVDLNQGFLILMEPTAYTPGQFSVNRGSNTLKIQDIKAKILEAQKDDEIELLVTYSSKPIEQIEDNQQGNIENQFKNKDNKYIKEFTQQNIKEMKQQYERIKLQEKKKAENINRPVSTNGIFKSNIK